MRDPAKRPDDGDGLLLRGIEGQKVVVVLEQDHGFAGGAEGQGGVFWRVDD